MKATDDSSAGGNARRIRVLGVLVLLLIVAISGFLLPSRMPAYQGKTLRQWLGALENVPNTSLLAKDYPPGSAEYALQQMGLTAVPFLIKMVNSRDSVFSEKIKTFLDSLDFIRLPYHHAGDEQIEALKGLSVLGPVAKPAIPAVVKLIQEGQNDPSRSLFVLSRIGPDSIPALIQLLQNTNETIRVNAAGYLKTFEPRHKLSLLR